MDILNEILTYIKDRNSLLATSTKENNTGTFNILFVSYNHFLFNGNIVLYFSFLFSVLESRRGPGLLRGSHSLGWTLEAIK